MKSDDDQQVVFEVFRQLLSQPQAQAMQLPLVIVAVGFNGSLFACRYSGGERGKDFKFLAANVESGRINTPVNIMFVEANGNARHLHMDSWPQSKTQH